MYVAIDIGGTKIRLTASKNSEVGKTVDFPTPKEYPLALEQIKLAVMDVVGENTISGVGISSPGPLDTKKGIILQPINLAWRNVDITTDLAQKLNTSVKLGHDATLGGVAEANFGAGREARVVLYITISTGVGSSIIIDKKPLDTTHNSEGGKQLIITGHGSPKSFETLASGRSIKHRYGKIAAEIHDPRIWDEITDIFAIGIYNMSTTVSPDVIVLGGGVSVHFDRFGEMLTNKIKSFSTTYPYVPVVQAKFVETAPLVGALWLAAQST